MDVFCSLVALLGLVPAGASPAHDAPGSFLYQPAFSIDYELRQPAEPYCPQPGDIFLATGREWWAKVGHWLAGSGAPQHSGIIFATRDGRMMLLEAGPHNTLHCRSGDVVPQLASYESIERVWIRRRKVPLTAEQSACLTAFAEKADGKRFALIRMFAQAAHLRCRGPLLDYGFGTPHGDRCSYFCAELVGEACVAASLFPAGTCRPAAMYPREFFFGRSNCPFIDQRLDMEGWCPPARWTPCPGAESRLGTPRPYLDGDNQ
jgi:hypothetical protein